MPRLFLAASIAATLVTSLLPQPNPADSIFQGLKLRNIGPANMSGRFVDVEVVESDPYIFYAASSTGGIFKTSNNGVTFEAVFERENTHSIGDIAVFQKDPSIVWVGTGERANRQSSSWGDGVYKSIDAGKTWTHMGLAESHHVGRIVTHPENPDLIYVAAMGHLWGNNSERGLYRTDDGGTTWRKILYVDEMTGVVDVTMDPKNPQILYAASYQRQRTPYGFHGGGPGSALYKTTDGGRNWKKLTRGLPEGDYGRIGISIYRKDPKIVYICVEQGLRYTASTSYEERRAGIYRSDNRGENWTFVSDWNPRPMYASQILVDPNNDQRIYMENAFSWSDDGGKTFTVPSQSIHSDDRHLWVNPNDSRHLIKASDGALATSYDKGVTWLFVSSLPVSQYYRVSVDMDTPYNIYGGLQDNGSWVGPSATYRAEGILNEDWSKLGGGDGFLSLPDPSDPNSALVESQYLGLTRVDLTTFQSRTIRPGNILGNIQSRRNWDVWGTDNPFPLLGNQMIPANWDGPYIFSPHNSKRIYAGTSELWRSSDGGESWENLGDLTTGVDRSKLPIMGQMPAQDTPSLDDGIPYYPTLTAIAESPLQEGLLYVGTDDGNLAVSTDAGQSWSQIVSRLGSPRGAWVSGIEPSRSQPSRVYAVLNNYRNDDFANYVYRSDDRGQSWRSIVSNLPPERVARTLREDPRNPDVLYLGAELGLFVSLDAGRSWRELKNNMPTLPFNDLVIHPRDNDLVLATHGRGVWILDQLNSIQELGSKLDSEAWLFTLEPAEMIRYKSVKAQAGDLEFRGENPPAGAIVDYYLGPDSSASEVSIEIFDAQDQSVRSLTATATLGINRAVWDLRHAAFENPATSEENQSGNGGGPQAPFVVPGRYRIELAAGNHRLSQSVEVREDPRIDLPESERRSWTQRLLTMGRLYEQVKQSIQRLYDTQREDSAPSSQLLQLYTELRRRIQGLYRQVEGWTGALTEDQKLQQQNLSQIASELDRRLAALN